MKVSSNAKYGTDKKAEKFWAEIYLHCSKLVTTASKINEPNADCIPVE